MTRIGRFFRHGGMLAWALIGCVVLIFAASTLLLADTADIRFERDISRMVFNDNLAVLDKVRQRVGETSDSLQGVLATATETPTDRPYIVVSIADHQLWYKQGESVLFNAPVATGSGKVLESGAGGEHWRFETPRGRLVVRGKDTDPMWVPPDWHYVEVARKRGLGIVRLERGRSLPTSDGGSIVVSGGDVVRRYADGREVRFDAGEGREIVAGGNVVVPPYGTNQRKFAGVLGSHRLELGDGYAIHGTDKPETIGRSVSHGCVRLRNDDIAQLYELVPVGTAVYIY